MQGLYGGTGIPGTQTIDLRTPTQPQQTYYTDQGVFRYDPNTGKAWKQIQLPAASPGGGAQYTWTEISGWTPPGAQQPSQVTLGGYGSLLTGQQGTSGTSQSQGTAAQGSTVTAPQTNVPVSPIAANIIGSAQQALAETNAANEQRYQQLQQVNQQMGQQQLDALRANYEQQMQMLTSQSQAQQQAMQQAQQQLMQQMQQQQAAYQAALQQAQQQQMALAQQPAQTGQQLAAQYNQLAAQVGQQAEAQQQTAAQGYGAALNLLQGWSDQAAARVASLERNLADAIASGDTEAAARLQASLDAMRQTVQGGTAAARRSIAQSQAAREAAAREAQARQRATLQEQYGPLAEEARSQYGQLLSTVGGDEARQMQFLEQQRQRQAGLIGGVSKAEYEREAQLRQGELGNLQQQLVSRGLGNTTVRVPLEQSIIDASRLREQEISDRRLREQLGIEQAYTGYGANVLGTTAARRAELSQAAIERPLSLRQEAARAAYETAGQYGQRLYETAAEAGAQRTTEAQRARELAMGVEQTGLSAEQERIARTTGQRLAAAQTTAETALGQMGQIAQTGVGLQTQQTAARLNIQQQAQQQANQLANQAIAALSTGYNAAQIQSMDTAQRLSALGLSYLQTANTQMLEALKNQLDQQLAGLTDQQRLALTTSRDFHTQQLAILDALRADLERIIESRTDVMAVSPSEYGALLASGAV